jgi:hypothetical protein
VLTGAVTRVVMLYGLGSIGLGALVAVWLHRVNHAAFFVHRTLPRIDAGVSREEC